jgi:16S rRNA (guanine527-N7)-methyltransferase
MSNSDLSPEELLTKGMSALLLSLDEKQQAKILRHIELLRLWNKTFNLLGRDDVNAILIHDVLDSLALYPFIDNTPILDMGSGAGFPGIPVAIALPRYHFTLLEANSKKASFLRQAVLDLELTHVSVLQHRAEHVQEQFNIVIARAFAPLPKLAAMATPLLRENGVLLAMQGKKPHTPLPSDQIQHLQVPFLAEKRTLVIRSKQ